MRSTWMTRAGPVITSRSATRVDDSPIAFGTVEGLFVLTSASNQVYRLPMKTAIPLSAASTSS